MAEPFTIQPHTTVDKSFTIDGPDIYLVVDYDDVDHKTVDREAKKVVNILNAHWNRRG